MTHPVRGSSWGYTATAGKTPPNAALTDDQVRDIRARLKAGTASRANIAAEFKLSKAAVQALATRRSYAHVR